MNILLVAPNPLAVSAYAQTANEIAKYLSDKHTVVYYGLNYSGIPIEISPGVKLVGNFSHTTGRVLLQHYIDEYKIDIVFTIKDPIVFQNDIMKKLSVPWVAFCPLDTEPVNIMTQYVLNQAYKVLTPTKWSQDELANIPKKPIQSIYTPHWVDDSYFAITKNETFRKYLHIPQNNFVASVIADNNEKPSRKNLEKILLAWLRFAQQHKNVVLYLHTNLSSHFGGVDLAALINYIELPERCYRFTSQTAYQTGLPVEFIRSIYEISNIYLAPSGGEGFCVPAVEAQMCGVNVVATDWTALKETCKHSPYLINTDSRENGDIEYHEWGGLRYRVNHLAIVDQLEKAYYDWEHNITNPEQIRENVINDYRIAKVIPMWMKAFEDIEKELAL